MASYASAAIALILGNIALGYYLVRPISRRCRCTQSLGNGTLDDCPTAVRPKRAPSWPVSPTRPIQITVLLLAAGTILGALWADKAWGRFWAWDPKEVWALISLLVYLLILHARYIGWSGDFGMAVAAVLGATAVLFTWYGVNFLLRQRHALLRRGRRRTMAGRRGRGRQWLFLTRRGVRYLIGTRRRARERA